MEQQIAVSHCLSFSLLSSLKKKRKRKKESTNECINKWNNNQSFSLKTNEYFKKNVHQEWTLLWVIIPWQYRLIRSNECTAVVQGVRSRGRCACQGMYGNCTAMLNFAVNLKLLWKIQPMNFLKSVILFRNIKVG